MPHGYIVCGLTAGIANDYAMGVNLWLFESAQTKRRGVTIVCDEPGLSLKITVYERAEDKSCNWSCNLDNKCPINVHSEFG